MTFSYLSFLLFSSLFPSAVKGTRDTFQGNTFDYQSFRFLEPIKKYMKCVPTQCDL